jgi:hypothetical protein
MSRASERSDGGYIGGGMSMWIPLLIAFQAKHFLADYPLQGRYMLGKFREDWGFVPPLLAHVWVHAFGTFSICFWLVGWKALLLALFDASVHFLMDRAKASKRYLGRWKPLTADTAPGASTEQWRSNDRFWWSLGFDQMVHHLTHYAIIWWVLRQVAS